MDTKSSYLIIKSWTSAFENRTTAIQGSQLIPWMCFLLFLSFHLRILNFQISSSASLSSTTARSFLKTNLTSINHHQTSQTFASFSVLFFFLDCEWIGISSHTSKTYFPNSLRMPLFCNYLANIPLVSILCSRERSYTEL